ncbi:Tectonic-3 [Manis pentadactyla]|nr:Tectonic-3 [Manis pentadactyla]
MREAFLLHFPAIKQTGREELSSPEAGSPGKAAGDPSTLMRKCFTQELQLTAWDPHGFSFCQHCG